MSHPYELIAVIIAAAGILGGWLNYLLSRKENPESSGAWQSLVGGIVASFMVPLFLNMISSNLLDSIVGTSTNSGDASKLFVLAGFCLVAAVSSRAFISSLSDRVLSEARAARKEVTQIKKEVDPIVAKETEKELPENVTTVSRVASGAALTDDEKKVLNALADRRYTYRTRSGIAHAAGMNNDSIIEILDSLVPKDLVRVRTIMINDQPKTRWFLTENGHAHTTIPEQAQSKSEPT